MDDCDYCKKLYFTRKLKMLKRPVCVCVKKIIVYISVFCCSLYTYSVALFLASSQSNLKVKSFAIDTVDSVKYYCEIMIC